MSHVAHARGKRCASNMSTSAAVRFVTSRPGMSGMPSCFGHCATKSGIAPFNQLVGKVMDHEPYRSASRVFWIVDKRFLAPRSRLHRAAAGPVAPPFLGARQLRPATDSMSVHWGSRTRVFQKVRTLAEILHFETEEQRYLGLVSHWRSPASIVHYASEPRHGRTSPVAVAETGGA